jgi:two-component system chemotaxis sensor kinase CheA
MISNDQLSAMFREEAGEHLSELEVALLSLDGDPGNEELIAQVFRHLHTIKGSAGMAGFTVITQFTHQIEAAFVEVRAGRVAVDKALVALSLEGMDLLRRMVAGEVEGLPPEAEALVQRFKAYGPSEPVVAGASASPGPSAPPRRTGGEKIYRILFKPNRELFLNGTNVLGILGA